MRFGVWYDFRNPPQWSRPWRDLYAETLDQIAWVDGLGFDSVWLSEHHVTDEGYLPSVFPVLAALAQRTQRVRLGTAVLLAPLHHPLRLAEDAAVVDVLSGGRLDLGIAPGYRTREFDALGVPKSQRGARTDETIEILRKAWTGQRFSHEGAHFSFPDVEVNPTPIQDPVPIWIGGSSEASASRAARYGCNYMPDSGAPRSVYDLYQRQVGDALAHRRIATNRVLYVCEDPEQGWNDVKEHYRYVFNTYRKWFAEAGDFPEFGEPLEDADELSRDLHIVGTPDTIAAEIERLRDGFPVDTLIFWARPPGLPIEKSSRSLELFAREVMPRFSP
jgi:probable F420-dependent oxidoreductase